MGIESEDLKLYKSAFGTIKGEPTIHHHKFIPGKVSGDVKSVHVHNNGETCFRAGTVYIRIQRVSTTLGCGYHQPD